MATTVALKLGLSVDGKAVVFAETASGKFSAVVDSTSNTSVTSSASSLRAAAVSTVAGSYVSNWSVSGGGKNSNGLVTWTSSSYTASYPSAVSITSAGPNVTVVDDHGTHLGTPTGTGRYYRSCVGVKHATTDDGYKFTGWTVTLSSSTESSARGQMLSSGGTKSGSSYEFSATDDAVVFQLGTSSSYPVTFTANYEQEQAVETCTLAYDANGGSPTPSPQSAAAGSSVTLAAAISKSGYSFTGWRIGSTTYAAGSSYTITGDVTAVAQWSQDAAKTCTVSFDKNADDVSGSALPSVVVSSGGSATLPDAALWTRSQHSFVGWSETPGATSVSHSAGDVVKITSDTTFYAVWAKTEGIGGHASTYAYSSKGGDNLYTKRYTDGYSFETSTNVGSVAVAMTCQTRQQGSLTETTRDYNPKYTTNPKVSTSTFRSQSESTTTTVLAGSPVKIPGDYQSCVEYSDSDTTSATHRTVTTVTSTTVGSDWKWTAPELDGFEFVGWFTIGQCYSGAQIFSDDDFTVKFCAEREVSFKDLLEKVNYVTTYAFDQYLDADNYTRQYTYVNYVHLRYVGVKVLVLLDATGGDLYDFYLDVRYDQAYGELPTPTWSGHAFLGWFTDATGGTQVTKDTTVATCEEHVLYAHWEDDGSGGETGATHTIAFDADGGSCATATKTATSGSAVGALPTPTKPGCAFDGWRDETGMQYTAASIMPAKDVTLTAAWTLSPITITFDANGGTCSTASRQIRPGAAIGALPSATKPDASLKGWFTAATGGSEVTAATTFSAAATIHAQWGASSTPLVIVKYPIKFSLDGGTLDASYVCKYTKGVAKTLPTAEQVAKPGATFAGWYEKSDFSGSAVTQIPAAATGTKTFYAKWN